MRSSSAAVLALVVSCLGLVVRGDDPPRVAKPLAPAEARARLRVADDLKLEQVLAEPAIAQPVSMTFDERGRLWVVQYLQYPFPAGLKILSKDRFLRATYDRVPPPPPKHFRGKDKITVHEDTDGDGIFDKHSTFLDGMNIVTAVAHGRGGAWILNPPYLLFYRTTSDGLRPVGDPEVHLEGFGLEDTHSVVNSLQWGPDGWLYAAQGSTVTAAVRRPGSKEPPVHSMGQLIWRYHPEQRKYEIFAEGGGNAFGVEIDSKGRIFSGHNGGDTRGFHYVQGGYSQKGFAKHGPLTNPYAFGYFAAMKHAAVPRFTHTFTIYEEAALPQRYRGRLLAVAPLQGHIALAELLPDRSSFQTRDLFHAVTAEDPWFRPVDIKPGPDGAVYVADFYEGQIAHLRHHEGQIDRGNGRIYRLTAPGAAPPKPFDLGRCSTPELVERLRHPSRWQRRTALRLLGDRKDIAAVPLLRKLLDGPGAQDALEALWGLHLCGAFDDALALRTLDHADPHVRLWTVRLLGDQNRVAPPLARKLAELARHEASGAVRSQLAATARRLPAADCFPIVRHLLARNEDTGDIHIPLLLWWALESKCATDRERVVALFEDPALWRLPTVQTHILHRLMRRYAAAGTRQDLRTCARLLQLAPDAERSRVLLRGFEEAFAGRALADLPRELAEGLARHGGGSVSLGLRQGRAEAVAKALALIADDEADIIERQQLIQILGEVSQPKCVPVLLAVVERSPDDGLRLAALTALQRYDAPEIATSVLRLYPKLTEEARAAAQTLLASRRTWALRLLQAVEAGQLERAAVAREVVRRLTAHRDEKIAALVAKHWGKVEGGTTAAMRQRIERLEQVLRGGTGSPYPGKKLYRTACAQCHQLFGQGGQVGPDLTSYQRTDLANLLLHIVNPSAEIREGYQALLVTTSDGRLLTGIRLEQDPQAVVLRTADGQTLTLARNQIEQIVPERMSLMPEGLLDSLTDQQVRDLFAYLRSTQPLYD